MRQFLALAPLGAHTGQALRKLGLTVSCHSSTLCALIFESGHSRSRRALSFSAIVLVQARTMRGGIAQTPDFWKRGPQDDWRMPMSTTDGERASLKRLCCRFSATERLCVLSTIRNVV